MQDELLRVLLQGTAISSDHLSLREHALLRYADRLTVAPSSVTRAHVSLLREAGFDDRAVHDACAIVAYFAFVNRVADGLGVELEPSPHGGG